MSFGTSTTSTSARHIPLGYLRAFLVVLVVLHHALLAYADFAPPAATSLDSQLLWTAFPVVDSHRWSGADLIVTFNDSFFMALMFLVSGVFAWPALVRKGAGRFLRDRVRRLAWPFLVAAGLLAPVAYLPTWLAAPAHAVPFVRQWLVLGVWPAGPAWFLWVLLTFAVVAALLFSWVPCAGARLARVAGCLGERPATGWLALWVLSALLYLPMTAAFDPGRWVKAGPFFVQVSRLPVYFLYFLVGLGVGAHGLDRGLLQASGRLARRWWLWVLLALAAFGLLLGTLGAILASLTHGGPAPGLVAMGNLGFVSSCAASSFACLAVFVRFAHRARPLLDHLAANAYGIYLLHYACVTWLQLALLPAAWSGLAKATLVFASALVASWVLAALLRRVPAVARVV